MIFQRNRFDVEFVERLDKFLHFSARFRAFRFAHGRVDIFFKRRETGVELHPARTAVCLIFQKHGLGDLLSDLDDRIEAGERVLKDHGDFIAADLMHILLGHLEEIFAVVEDLAALHDRVSRKDSQNRLGRDGLSRTRFAHDCKRFSALKVEGDLADRLHRTLNF